YIRTLHELPPGECAAILECRNCRQSCVRLTFVPEYEIEMCDTCLDEANAALAQEKVEGGSWSVCLSRFGIAQGCSSTDEFRRLLKAHQAECVVCSSTRKTVISDRSALGTPAAVCCEQGRVA